MSSDTLYRCFLCLVLAAAWTSGGCDTAANAPGREIELNVPRGYVPRLEILSDGRLYGFGPFVGYYFRQVDPHSFEKLDFVVFNERGFYTQSLPVNAMLFEGDAVLKTLPPAGLPLPSPGRRIQPVFFDEAPEEWKSTRPEPQEEYLHFHSCYDAGGAARSGYWLRHRAVADFTYDMGGRVGEGSPLYHRVSKGVDRRFARIVEFDRGPQ